jgi:hypothetical protein
VVRVVHDERAALGGQRREHRVHRAGRVLAGLRHDGRGVAEAGVRHGPAQPGGKQLGRRVTLVQHDLDGHGPPRVGEFGAEHGLAVSRPGLNHDHARVGGLCGQPRAVDMMRRQTGHATTPSGHSRPPAPAFAVVGSLPGSVEADPHAGPGEV